MLGQRPAAADVLRMTEHTACIWIVRVSAPCCGGGWDPFSGTEQYPAVEGRRLGRLLVSPHWAVTTRVHVVCPQGPVIDLVWVLVYLFRAPRAVVVAAYPPLTHSCCSGRQAGNRYVALRAALGGLRTWKKEGEKHEPAVWLVVVSPPPGCIELLCCVVSAVTYSPTPWRVQYHQRGQA